MKISKLKKKKKENENTIITLGQLPIENKVFIIIIRRICVQGMTKMCVYVFACGEKRVKNIRNFQVFQLNVLNNCKYSLIKIGCIGDLCVHCVSKINLWVLSYVLKLIHQHLEVRENEISKNNNKRAEIQAHFFFTSSIIHGLKCVYYRNFPTYRCEVLLYVAII